MKIHWNLLAEKQLDQSIAFVEENWGKSAAQKMLHDTHRIIKLLVQHPHLGHPEPLLSDRKLSYRSIVVERHNKIVYYIKDSIIHIAALWDTRRDPSLLSSDPIEDQ